ncbi:hypothetical protein [Alicyclobacillus sp. ALC3]|uniref:hypothetical protein n=1 Tax=Alicyclobacillus sp. ALC3 TaxID=2796143 RepID=UPI0023790CBA|nr:hypothetical protein [Alicyclobacillus sp. ALC3]WDL98329.1 hypothetical protein JC200_06480 [Alicyclobacillus sp. ALC3]
MNRHEDHTTVSGLGFTVSAQDLKYVNEYPGQWELTGQPEKIPENYWLITHDGQGHNVRGHLSPQQILDWGRDQGWQCAYVAPYGHHVMGAEDEVQLHDWLRERQRRAAEEAVDQHLQ